MPLKNSPTAPFFFACVHLLNRCIHAMQRQDGDPAQAAVCLGEDLGEIAIVCGAERALQDGVVGDVNQKQRRVNDLDGHTGFVHVGEAHLDVGDLARGAQDIAPPCLAFRRRRSDQAEAAFARGFGKDVAVDQPHDIEVAVLGVFRRGDHHRPARFHGISSIKFHMGSDSAIWVSASMIPFIVYFPRSAPRDSIQE